MAKATNYAAFQQLRPLQGDVSQDMKYWNDDAGIRRREKQQQQQFNSRQAQAAQQAQARENTRRQEQYSKYAKPYELKDTGNRSLNTVQAEYLINAREKIKELIPQLDEAKNKGDYKTEFALLSKLEELNKAPEKFVGVVSAGMNFWKQIDEDFQKGLINEEQYKSEKEKYQDYYNNMRVGIDDDLNPIVFFMDKNNNGINDLEEQQSPVEAIGFQDFLSGQAFPSFYSNDSVDGLAENYAKSFKMHTETTDNGYKKRTITQMPEDAIKNAAKADLIDSKGNYTKTAKGLAYRMGFDPEKLTNEQVDEMVNKVVEASKPLYATKDVESRRASISSGGSTKPTTNVFDTLSNNRIRPTENEFGAKIEKITPNNRYSIHPFKSVQIGNRVEQQLPTFNTIKDLDSGESYSNTTIESYTYDDDGNMVARISYVFDKGGKDTYDDVPGVDSVPEKKQEAVIKVSKPIERDIADFLGISIEKLRSLAIEDNTKEQYDQKTTPATAADIFKKGK